MKIQNSTTWPTWFLRRMTSWCAQQIGMPIGTLHKATFRNSRSVWGGHAQQWGKSILVTVGRAGDFPANCATHQEGSHFADREECLVAVTAHELFHIDSGRVGGENFNSTRMGRRGYRQRGHSSERLTCMIEMRVLDVFRANREALMLRWGQAPAYAVPRAAQSIQDRNRAKAIADLERWARKLKLAQTKVRKLKVRVRYYERKALTL